MRQKREQLDLLIDKYLKGQASVTEAKLLQNWLLQLDFSNHQVFEDVSEEEVAEKMKLYIRSRTLHQQTPVRKLNPFPTWLRAAAASILLLISAVLCYSYFKESNSPAITVMETSGSSIKRVTLPDGTVVTLNKYASLELNKNYNQNEREVKLVGEAFFEVKHDTLRPFIVMAHNTFTRVLGTAFNVESYEGEEEVRVALLHGEVRVRHDGEGQATLRPGQALVYDRASRKGTIEAVVTQHIAAWLQNKIVFDDVSLADAIHRIQYLHQLNIQLDPTLALQGKRVTGEYESDEAIKALEAILLLHNMKLKTKGGTLIITDNP